MDQILFNWLIFYILIFSFFMGQISVAGRTEFFVMCFLLSMAPLFILSTLDLRKAAEYQRDNYQ